MTGEKHDISFKLESFLLADCNYDGCISFTGYDAETQEIQAEHSACVHVGAINCISWVGGKAVITGGCDEFAKITNLATGAITSSFIGKRGAAFIEILELDNTQYCVIVSKNGDASVYDIKNFTEVQHASFAQRNHKGVKLPIDIRGAAANPEIEGLYAVMYLNGDVQVWLAEKKYPVAKIYTNGNTVTDALERPFDVQWMDRGKTLAFIAKKQLTCVDIESGQQSTYVLEKNFQGNLSAFATHGELAVIALSDGSIRVLKASDGMVEVVMEKSIINHDDVRQRRIRAIKQLPCATDSGLAFMALYGKCGLVVIEISEAGECSAYPFRANDDDACEVTGFAIY